MTNGAVSPLTAMLNRPLAPTVAVFVAPFESTSVTVVPVGRADPCEAVPDTVLDAVLEDEDDDDDDDDDPPPPPPQAARVSIKNPNRKAPTT